MRTGVVIGALLIALSAGQLAAQQPAGSQAQPGLKWSDEQIRKTADHVRAGRKLTPKTWPNGARVAVCLSVDPDNFSIALNAGNTNPVADFARRVRRARGHAAHAASCSTSTTSRRRSTSRRSRR